MILLDEKGLKTRENDVRKIISVLCSDQLSAHGIPSSAGYTITLFKGAKQSQMGVDSRGYKFKTLSEKFLGQYIEFWSKNIEKNRVNFFLHSIMLNMFRVTPNHEEPKEFFNLHCEPTFSQTIEKYKQDTPFTNRRKKFLTLQEKYKKLHIHIPEADDPLKHAHIAIHLGSENQILSSLKNLDNTMKELIQMIRNELFEVEFCNLKYLDTVKM